MTKNIFICYSKDDKKMVGSLAKGLAGHGFNCITGHARKAPGKLAHEEIARYVSDCDMMLFVWTESSNRSMDAAYEIAVAREKGKQIVALQSGSFDRDAMLACRLAAGGKPDVRPFDAKNPDLLAGCLKKLLGCGGEGEEALRMSAGEMYEQGRKAAARGNYGEANGWYIGAAGKGSEEAMTSLARNIEQDRISDDDIDRTNRVFAKLAKQGNDHAMFRLAENYFFGRGFDTDSDKAVKLFRKSAANGNDEAMLFLAGIYYDGDGVDMDIRKAFKWYQKAAEAGNAEAMFEMAWRYSEGEGTRKDQQKAFQWFLSAAENGFPSAYPEVAVRYGEGNGTDENPAKSFEWMLKAADSGFDWCIRYVVQFYEEGYGTEKNLEKAGQWRKKLEI